MPEDLSDGRVLIVREQIIAGSPWYCLWGEQGVDQVTILCLTEGEKAPILEGSVIDWDEDEVTRTITENTVVVMDPLYHQVYPVHRDIVFMDFPHEACPSRMYHSIMKPFVYAPSDSV